MADATWMAGRAAARQSGAARRHQLQLLNPQREQQKPGEQNDFRSAGEHLHRADQRGQDDFLSAVAPRQFDREHDPRHPTERGDVTRPHEQVERQAVERKGHAGKGRRKIVSRSSAARGKYMPKPANHKCSRQKKLNDHVSGSRR